MKKRVTQLKFWAMTAFLFCQFFTNAQTIYGLTTDGKLVTFAGNATTTVSSNTITGVASGQVLVGIDVRPATGELFALGYNAANDSVSLYVINTTTAVATAKATSLKLTGLGSSVGFDFNPTVDRIRLESKTGKNYRLNPNNGALAATDSTLRYAATDVNVGKIPGVTAAAYTNSYIGSTATRLYVYDETQKVLTFQNPPNDGILNTQPAFSGISSTSIVSDLDIYSNPVSFASTVFALVKTGSVDSLYSLNLTTGALTTIGSVAGGVVNIAVAINRTVPALQGNLAYGLSFTAGNMATNLLKFDTKNPSVIRSSQVVTGLKTGQTIMGMDMRPQDAKIYALGYRALDSVATIYTLNDTTAVLSVFTGADSFKLALGTGQVTFDFNPVANRLRIIGATNNNNYRLNLTVSPITITVDTALTYKASDINAGKTPLVVAGAYTSSFNGATATQLYDIDASLGILVNQNSANGGFLNTIGTLGIALDPADYTVDLDVFSTKTPSVDSMFLMANIVGSGGFDNLYSVNTATGSATLIGRIGQGSALRYMTVQVSPAVTATKDLAQTLKVNVYPNPATQNISINFDASKTGGVRINIYNLQGQLVSQAKYETFAADSTQTLDVSGLNTGTYFLLIETDSERAVKKFVKF